LATGAHTTLRVPTTMSTPPIALAQSCGHEATEKPLTFSDAARSLARCAVGITTITGPLLANALTIEVGFASGETTTNPPACSITASATDDEKLILRDKYLGDGTFEISVLGADAETKDLIRPAHLVIAQCARSMISSVVPSPKILIIERILLTAKPALGSPISITQPATFLPCNGTRTRMPTRNSVPSESGIK